MKIVILSILLLCWGVMNTDAQINETQIQCFLKELKLVNTSGDGLKQSSGDILLELVSDEPDDYETLILLRNDKGKLKKIAENSSLLIGHGLIGVSGGNYPSLSENTLLVDYTIGSSSTLTDVSIVFEKAKDGQYYFKERTSRTRNYGVENLYARERVTATQTGKIKFSEAVEAKIIKKANVRSIFKDPWESLSKATQQYADYIPRGFQVAAFAEGDLNLDNQKKDAVLVLYNRDECNICLLIQQSNGKYKIVQNNNCLISNDENFNINNIKAVVKKGYFTIEQRIVVGDQQHFDHRYITFKYAPERSSWLLHRFDAEHYSAFDTSPSKDVTHLTKKEFGNIVFSKMKSIPGVHNFNSKSSKESGKK